MEMVKQDNQQQFSARIEQLEQEVADLWQALADKKEQEAATLKVLMRVEKEQRVIEDTRVNADHDADAQRYVVQVLQEKYDKAMAYISEMEKKVATAESMLEATLHYTAGQVKALSSPRSVCNQGSAIPTTPRKIGLLPFGLGWRDRNKGKPTNVENSKSKSQALCRKSPKTKRIANYVVGN